MSNKGSKKLRKAARTYVKTEAGLQMSSAQKRTRMMKVYLIFNLSFNLALLILCTILSIYVFSGIVG